MVSTVLSTSLKGIDSYIVSVEVDISLGLPSMSIVGLPDTATQESRERVKSAIRNSDFAFPAKKITINLAPADIKKEGPSLDLAISLGILASSEQLNADNLEDFIVIGELSLDGSVRGINGVLCYALAAKENNIKYLIVPEENANEASFVAGIKVYPVKTLLDAVNVISDRESFEPIERTESDFENNFVDYAFDFSDVKGQETAKRALEIASAGNHNILMVGPPGSGKTMLSRRIPSILPPLSFSEALEVTKLYSISGLLPQKKGLVTERPFRSPHHQISNAGLVGGTSNPRPGEISLAHHGVLFLDELLEFHRSVLELLRQPIEDGVITISRALLSITYPANFMFVAALNPCPCGHRGDTLKECVCTQHQVERYWNKLSGPLLDRIDLHLEVPRLKNSEILSNKTYEPSKNIRERVIKARTIQLHRFKDAKIFTNSQMQAKHLRQYCKLDETSIDLLKKAITHLKLSARANDRILKVARTIADLENSENIQVQHIAEAVQYRSFDRVLF